MAWEGGFAGDAAFYRSHIRPAADFVVNHGPAYGVERWEEHPGYSPSTLAAEIAGLVAASRLAAAAGDTARASLYGYAQQQSEGLEGAPQVVVQHK